MATSGRFDGTCHGSSGNKYNLWLTWTINSQSPINNTSHITVNMYLQRNDGYANSAYNLSETNPVRIFVDGVAKVDTTVSIDTRNNAVVLLATWTGFVTHNYDGTLSVDLSGDFGLNGVPSLTGGIVVGTAQLDTIDRNAPILSASISNIGTDRFTLTVNTNETCDKYEYSLDGGNTYKLFYGSPTKGVVYTITGLSPSATYSLRVRARRASNYIYGFTGIISVTTLGKSTISNVSTISADAAIPSMSYRVVCGSAAFTHIIDIMDGANVIVSITGLQYSVGTNDVGLSIMGSNRTTLLQYMTNKKSFTATIRLRTYNGATYIGESSITTNITTSEELSRPDFGAPTYSDINSATVAVTGNNQILIQGFSQLRVVCPTATPKNEATIKSYSVRIGDRTVTDENPTINVGIINATGDLTLVATVTDSRGYSNSYSVPVKVLPYTLPKITEFSMRRQNSIGETIILEFSGNADNIIVGGTEKNSIVDIKYRYRKTNEENFGSFISIKNASTINGLEFSYSSNAALTLDPGSSYAFEFVITDRITSYTKDDVVIRKGTPEISIRKGKVGICNPDPEEPLDIGGAVKANGYYTGFVRVLSYDDANNLKKGGIYGYIVLPGWTYDSENLPTYNFGVLEVIPCGLKGSTDDSAEIIIQRFTDYEGTIYQRVYSFLTDEWTAWRIVASKDGDISDELYQHTSNYNNPHNVTKAQIGLGNVDNTSDMDKPVSTAQQAAINAAKYTHPTGDGYNHIPAVGTTNVGKVLKAIAPQTAAWAKLVAADIDDFGAAVAAHTEVQQNTAARHSHSNKSVLDNTTASYTTDEKNKLAAVDTSKQHTHNNKAVLDGTTASFTAEEKGKLASIDISIQHSHNNKTILDATTAAFTVEQRDKLTEIDISKFHAQDTDSGTNKGSFYIYTEDPGSHGAETYGIKLEDFTAEFEEALALYGLVSNNFANLHIKDLYARNITATGTINGKASEATKSDKADKLTTARTISLSGDVSGAATFDGGSNITINTQVASKIFPPLGATRFNLGDPSLFEVAAFQEEFNNKTAFFDPANISYQTSSDGVNWTEYIVSSDITRCLFGGDDGGTLSIPNGTKYFRIKLRAPTSFYVYLNALYMYCSTSGHSCKVHIYKKHDSGAYTQHTSSDVNASTWPGHVYVPFSTIPWNGNAVLGTHFHEVYIVIIPNWNSNYTSDITLYKIQLWGGYPAGSRNVWKVDQYKNVIFPSYIKVGNSTDTDSATCYYFEKNGDGYLRKKPLVNVRTEIVTSSAVTTALGFTPVNPNRGGLPNGDFNQALTEGEYNVGAIVSNNPTNTSGYTYGKLHVYVNDGGTHNGSTNWIWQYFDDTSGRRFFRYKVNAGAWTPWQDITPSQYAKADHTHSQYAPLASPAFEGLPTVPTASAGTSSKQIANTEFVMQALSGITISGFPYLGELSKTTAGDFNNLTTTGWWYWGWSSIMDAVWSNEPEPTSTAVDNFRLGILKVYAPNTSYVLQEFIALATGTIYIRTRIYDTWTAWATKSSTAKFKKYNALDGNQGKTYIDLATSDAFVTVIYDFDGVGDISISRIPTGRESKLIVLCSGTYITFPSSPTIYGYKKSGVYSTGSGGYVEFKFTPISATEVYMQVKTD